MRATGRPSAQIEATSAACSWSEGRPRIGPFRRTEERVSLARALVHGARCPPRRAAMRFHRENWLERRVAFPGRGSGITHDRRFSTRSRCGIVELDRGLERVSGNYRPISRRGGRATKPRPAPAQVRQGPRAGGSLDPQRHRGAPARGTKAGFVRLEALRIDARGASPTASARSGLELAEGERSGRLVADLEQVGKRYGDKRVVEKFSCRILRGDKVGLMARTAGGRPRCSGLILGEIRRIRATVHRGTKLAVAYFRPVPRGLDEDATLGETISQGSDHVEVTA